MTHYPVLSTEDTQRDRGRMTDKQVSVDHQEIRLGVGSVLGKVLEKAGGGQHRELIITEGDKTGRAVQGGATTS